MKRKRIFTEFQPGVFAREGDTYTARDEVEWTFLDGMWWPEFITAGISKPPELRPRASRDTGNRRFDIMHPPSLRRRN